MLDPVHFMETHPDTTYVLNTESICLSLGEVGVGVAIKKSINKQEGLPRTDTI